MAGNDRPEAATRADQAVDWATGAPHDGPKYAERPDTTADRDALEGEQRREADQAWAGPGMPSSTDAQWKGLVTGSLVGGAIGLVLFVPLAFIPVSGLSLTGRLILCAIVGAVMGGTVGALYMGGRQPELEGETMDADGRPSVGTTLRDPGTDERGR